MTKRAFLVAGLVVALAGSSAWAQRSVDRTVPTVPDGLVEVESLAGAVVVEGWGRSEVQVTGTLGRGVDELEIESDGQRVSIEVRLPRNVRSVGDTELTIHVPAGSRIEVETVSATIDVSGVRGGADLESVSGDIDVVDRPERLQVSTVSGKVTVADAPADADLESVSGTIVVRQATERLRASSVSGTLRIEGGTLRGGEFETVSGTIRCDADLVGSGSFSFETMSGSVVLVVPRSLAADFELSTFSGSISNDIGPEPERTSRFTPGKEARFSTGPGGPRISASSFSGSVKIQAR